MHRIRRKHATAPVGLDGVHRMSSRDLGVSAASNCSGLIRKPCSGDVGTISMHANTLTTLKTLPLLTPCNTIDQKTPYLLGWMVCTG
jgi:hypothetical protein